MRVLCIAAIVGLAGVCFGRSPLTTGFTYQGSLTNASQPASGTYDLSFRLFDAASGGAQVGSTVCVDNVGVVNGVFTVSLDFGAQFAGQQRFIEVSVRQDTGLSCANSAGFTTLTPRQELKASPNALYATAAASATTAVNATTATTATNATQLNGQSASFYQNAGNLTGTIPGGLLGGTYGGAVTLNNAANSFIGSGAGLTGLNAGNVSTGTLADARLSGNVALLGANNAFTGTNTFAGATAFQGFTGVGTNTPVSAAEVFGVRRTTGPNDWGGMYVETTDATGRPFYGFSTAGAQRAWIEYNQNPQALQFVFANIGAPMTVTPSFVGVNTGTPVSASTVFGVRRTTPPNDWGGMYVETSDATGRPFYGFSAGGGQSAWIEYQGGTHSMLFVVNQNPTLTVLPDAVGIRTTNPHAELDIQGNGNADVLLRSGIPTNAINLAAATGPSDTKATLYVSQSDGTSYFDRIIVNAAGTVQVPGLLSKGGGSFQIDHPLDPENKYLYHSFVESPDMKNIYDGVATTDGTGYATISLPDWFQALNSDFRYQLTVIDEADQDDVLVWAKVVKKIGTVAPNQFTIRSSRGGVEVSWQVTGIRQDAFAKAHRIVPEVEKAPGDKGKYLHPEAFGQPWGKGIFTSRTSDKPGGQHGPVQAPVVQP